jgi:replication protein RepL
VTGRNIELRKPGEVEVLLEGKLTAGGWHGRPPDWVWLFQGAAREAAGRVGAAAFGILMFLVARMGFDGLVEGRTAEIAEGTGTSVRTVRRHLKSLAAAGAVRRIGPGTLQVSWRVAHRGTLEGWKLRAQAEEQQGRPIQPKAEAAPDMLVVSPAIENQNAGAPALIAERALPAGFDFLCAERGEPGRCSYHGQPPLHSGGPNEPYCARLFRQRPEVEQRERLALQSV